MSITLGLLVALPVSWPYQDTMYLVDYVRKQRLLRGGSGRQSSHGVVSRDWSEVSTMTDEEAGELLRSSRELD